MKCVRCNRETSGDLTVAGQVVGPTCFRKMFPELVKTRKTKVVHQEQLGLTLLFSDEEPGENGDEQQGTTMTPDQIEGENAEQLKKAIKILIKADVDDGLLKSADVDAATIALASRVLSDLCDELGYNAKRLFNV